MRHNLTRPLLLITIVLLAACQRQPAPAATGDAIAGAASPESTILPTTAPSPSPGLPPASETAAQAHTPTTSAAATVTPTPTPSPTATAVPLPIGEEMSFELLAQEGGEIHSVAVAGDRVFVGAGLRVVALDAANPARPRFLGRSEPLPGPVRALLAVAQGALVQLYAGAGDSLVTLVSAPAGDLLMQDTLPLPGWVNSLALGEDALFAGGAPPGAAYPEGGFIAMVDARQPTALDLLQDMITLSEVSALAVGRGVLYSAHYGLPGPRLMVTEVRDAQMAEPTALGASAELYTLQIIGDTLIAGGYGALMAFDIAAPGVPEPLWQIEEVDGLHLGMVNGLAYANEQFYLSGWQPAGAYIPFRLVQSPPQPLGDAPGLPASSDVVADDGRLYIAEAGDLEIYDISRPQEMLPAGGYPPAFSAVGEVAIGRPASRGEMLFLYAASPFDNEPEELLTYHLPMLEPAGRLTVEEPESQTQSGPGTAFQFLLDGDRAYLTTTSGIAQVDVANPDAPRVISYHPFTGDWLDGGDLIGMDDFLYHRTRLATGPQIDAYTLETNNLSRAATWRDFEGLEVQAMAGAAGRLYVTSSAHAEEGWLQVIEADGEMELVATLALPGFPGAAMAVQDGLLATTADDRLLLIDVTTPQAPAILAAAALPTPGNGPWPVVDLLFHDALLFVAVSGQQVLALDVAEPARPRVAGSVAPSPGRLSRPFNLAVSGDHLVVANASAGILVYQIGQAGASAAPQAAAYCPHDAPPTAAAGPVRVYYAEDGELRVWDEATDSSETLAEGGVYRLYLSPDGETVAFLRQEEPGLIDGSKQMALWAVDAGGGNERLLIGGDALRAMGPQRIGDFDVLAMNPIQLAWLPGTDELAFRVYPVIHALGADMGREIRLVDTVTGAQRVLMTMESNSRFSFSPDGQRMTLSGDTGIDLLDVNGGNRLPDVVTYAHIGLGHGGFQATPIWSDDGTAFSVPIPSGDPFGGDATLTVWEVAAGDGAALEMATFTGFPMPFVGMQGSAIFSPDRSQIAFYRTPERSNMGDLRIAAVQGAWQVAYDSGWGPRFLGWAPDGAHFAYAVGQGRVQRLLRIGRLCQRPVIFEGPSPAGDTPVTWIDGERFLYQSGQWGRTALLLGALDGSVREIGRLTETLDSYGFAISRASAEESDRHISRTTFKCSPADRQVRARCPDS